METEISVVFEGVFLGGWGTMMVFYVKDHETQACEFFIIISSMGMIAACQSHINDETRFWFFRLKIRCFVRATCISATGSCFACIYCRVATNADAISVAVQRGLNALWPHRFSTAMVVDMRRTGPGDCNFPRDDSQTSRIFPIAGSLAKAGKEQEKIRYIDGSASIMLQSGD